MRTAKTILVLAVLLTASAAAAPPPAASGGCGAVSGSVSLDRARVKFDGPKSGRYVVVSLEREGLEPEMVAAEPPLHMDQKGLVFVPHVMALQVGRAVEFLNSDNDRHNVYFLHDETGETLDIGTWGPGVSVTHRFEKPGLFITLCTLHLEMAAYILAFPHPYYCVAEIDAESGMASYAIENVPAGEYAVRVWHKKLKQMKGPKSIVVVAGETTVRDDTVTKSKYAR